MVCTREEVEPDWELEPRACATGEPGAEPDWEPEWAELTVCTREESDPVLDTGALLVHRALPCHGVAGPVGIGAAVAKLVVVFGLVGSAVPQTTVPGYNVGCTVTGCGGGTCWYIVG
jgi:hypothetical protein